MFYYIGIFLINIFCHSIITFTLQKYNKDYYDFFENCFHKRNIKQLIKYSFIIVMVEDPCFRLLLPYLLNLYFENNIKLYSALIFSLGHMINYINNFNYIKLMPFQLLNTFILSYFILHEVHPLYSLFFHEINNIFIILIMYYLYKYFPNKYDHDKIVKNIIQYYKVLNLSPP
jgi:hypothetical protein